MKPQHIRYQKKACVFFFKQTPLDRSFCIKENLVSPVKPQHIRYQKKACVFFFEVKSSIHSSRSIPECKGSFFIPKKSSTQFLPKISRSRSHFCLHANVGKLETADPARSAVKFLLCCSGGGLALFTLHLRLNLYLIHYV